MNGERSRTNAVGSEGPELGALWWAWHAAALAALVVIPYHLRVGPIWHMDPRFIPFVIGMCAVYATGAAWLALALRRSAVVGVRGALACGIVPLAAFLLYLLGAEAPYPRSVLLPFAVFSPLALTVSVVARGGKRSVATAAVAALVVTATLAGERAPLLVSAPGPSVETRIVASSLYNLRVTYFRNYFAPNDGLGGGIAPLGSGNLVLLGDGQLFFVSIDPDYKGISVTDLKDPLPMGREAFLNDMESHPSVDTRYLRAADVIAQDLGNRYRIFASYLHWDGGRHCATLRVSAVEVRRGSLEDVGDQSWKTIFEANPCLGIKDTGNSFAGHESGGRLGLLDSQSLLLTTGDLEFNGVEGQPILAQDEASSYGKTILIDLRSGASRIFTKGHRSPGGLYVGPEGEVWETEHGPQGGDELNRIIEGRNYGWPLVTYGTNYDSLAWPLNKTNGRHEGYEPPVYSWVPSVGASAVLELQRGLFDDWQGDVLVASLTGQAIWRLRPEGDRIVLAEPIDIEDRIRDMVEGPAGELLLLTEGPYFGGPRQPSIIVVEPTDQKPPVSPQGGPS